MQKVKMLSTGEVLEVSNNEAHDLVDGKKAVIWRPEVAQYSNRQMTTDTPTPKGRTYKQKYFKRRKK